MLTLIGSWRLTDRPGDALNFRFYERQPTDTITPAIKAGLLDPENPALPLLRAWADFFPEATQCCDFCPEKGLVKTWLYLGAGGLRLVDDVLNVPGVPSHITRHRDTLCSLGLTRVRHIAVDFIGNTVNIYGPLPGERVRAIAALGDPERPLLDEEVSEMARFTSPEATESGVTFRVDTGDITRTAWYAFLKDRKSYPRLDARIKTFFELAPSYDDEPGDIVGWSFGPLRYMKVERNYSGNTVALMRNWALSR